jgi:hypothetical protein
MSKRKRIAYLVKVSRDDEENEVIIEQTSGHPEDGWQRIAISLDQLSMFITWLQELQREPELRTDIPVTAEDVRQAFRPFLRSSGS